MPLTLNHPPFDDPSFEGVARLLAPFDVGATVAAAGGLLTVPAYATACVRLDALANLALIHCRGTARPGVADLRTWVDDVLGTHPVAQLEDPLEDVFVSAIAAPDGVYRIIEGTWERNDAHLQDALAALPALPAGPDRRRLVREVRALLTLSEEVCRRRHLERWFEPEQTVPRRAVIGEHDPPTGLADAVTFSAEELRSLDVSAQDLRPFVAPVDGAAHAEFGAPPLERRPLVRFGNRVVLASPTSVSAAIRAHVLAWADTRGALDACQSALAEHQSTRVFRTLRLDGHAPPAAGLPGVLGHGPVGARMDEAVLVIDADKLAHVVILHDDLHAAARDRVCGAAEVSEETLDALYAYIGRTAAELLPYAPGGGMTLVALAGLGRARAIKVPRYDGEWQVTAAGADDVVTLVEDPEWDLLRLWRMLLHEAAVESAGVALENPNGPLNLAAYWRHHGYSLVPGEVPYPPPEPTVIIVGNDFVRRFRAQRRREDDVHALPLYDGRSVVARRLNARAYFQALRERPVYAVTEAAAERILAGAVETPHLVAWVVVDARGLEGGARAWAYQLWEAALTWLDPLLALAAPHVPPAARPVRIDLRIHEPAAWEDIDTATLSARASQPPTSARTGPSAIRIDVTLGFLALLARPANDAERALVHEVARHLPALVGDGGAAPWPPAETLVDQCFRGRDARQIHLLEASSSADPLARGGKPTPFFAPPEERAAWELGLAWRAQLRPTGGDLSVDHLVEDRDACVRLLHRLVEVVWEGLRGMLAAYDRESLVRAALENADEVHRDRVRWRRTARALASMPATGEEAARVAAAREGERSVASSACRTLVEMGVCTCRASGGRAVGRGALGTLMAGTALLLELATNSDALQDGPPAPGLRLRPNGYVDVEQPWFDVVAAPYVRASFDEGWQAAIAGYERHVAGQAPAVDDGGAAEAGSDDPGFSGAFQAEYGLTPQRLAEAVAECVVWGRERGEATFVVTRDALAGRLVERRQFSLGDVDALLRSFALAPRARWDQAPPGFTGADWFPWRHRRRLSLMARPLVLLDDPAAAPAGGGRVTIAVGQLVASLEYLLGGLRAGWFQQAFVSSRAMKSYLGAAADRHGAEFTARAAAACRAAGWEAQTEVKMTQLGAPAELGDVDVIAWRPGDPRLLCIECKRLRPARTVDEILEVLTRFRGQAKDLLDKHLRRVAWIHDNLPSAARGLRTPIAEFKVSPLLVTNAVVPMQFVDSLPLPRDRVIAFDQLSAALV